MAQPETRTRELGHLPQIVIWSCTHTHMHAAVKTSEGIEVVLHKRENL